MITIFWLLTVTSLIIVSGLLVYYAFFSASFAEMRQIIKNGFLSSLQSSGFSEARKDSNISHYKWAIVKEGEICDDCIELLSYEPMDISEWMQVDLPDAKNQFVCGGECRCKLIKNTSHQNPSKPNF